MKRFGLVWRFVPVLVLLALALLFVWALNRPDRDEVPPGRVGEPVPAFSLPVLNADGERTETIFEGQWSLLNVWASWCRTCYVEHPYLMELADRGVRIVGLNYKNARAKARTYLQDGGDPYVLTLVDRDGDYGLDLGVYGAPETWVISPEGVVKLRHAGELNRDVWQRKIAPIWEGGSPYDD